MSGLNPQQQEAATYLDGPLLVIAGAGSGKTRVITQKMAYLVQDCQISPKNIYAITFTNKAAKEMSGRVNGILGGKKKSEAVRVSTFHVLGLNILKRHPQEVDLNSNFSLFDAQDSLNLLQELAGKIAVVSDENTKVIQNRISQWKNDLISSQAALSQAQDEPSHLAARFYIAYENSLKAYNAVDFDDLIISPIKLFQENPSILEQWQNTIRYLLVDEYQDTNTAQYHLIKLLTGVRQALTVVGDDDQSIYAWRGAKAENIPLLQQDFPNLKVVKLEQNYRSTSTILRAANHLISHNPHVFVKQLWSTLGLGDPIRIIALSTEHAEVERIVHEITAHQFRYRLSYENYAILYRSNHQARILEQALREQGIPYQISGGTSFFDRSEVKDLFAYLRLMLNPLDDTAFLRCVNTPRRDIGSQTVEKLGLYAKERQISLFNACFEMGLSTVLPDNAYQRLTQFAEFMVRTHDALQNQDDFLPALNEFINDIDYYQYLADHSTSSAAGQKRIENVKDFLAWLTRMTRKDEQMPLSFQEAIQKMALIDILDKQSNSQAKPAVQLMTLHAAKGLEFPHVYMMGMEEEILPHRSSIEQDSIEEERRLAYVGMTRAQKTLTLTYAKAHKKFSELVHATPSRFLSELPVDLVQWEGNGEPVSEEKQREQGQGHLNSLKALLKQE